MTEEDVELKPTQCPDGTKPCPFCGGAPMLLTANFKHTKARWWVSCMACSADGSWATTVSTALNRWNTREVAG